MKIVIALAVYWACSIAWTFAMCAMAARPRPKCGVRSAECGARARHGKLITLNPRLVHS